MVNQKKAKKVKGVKKIPLEIRNEMKQIKLIKEGLTNYKYNGASVYEYKFRVYKKKDKDLHFISGNAVIEYTKDLLKDFPDAKEYKCAINAHYLTGKDRKGSQWMFSEWKPLDKPTLTHPAHIDSFVLVMEDDIDAFNILIRHEEEAAGGATHYNDCLYDCIFQAHNFKKESMPKPIRAGPHKVKSILGLEREDKVPFNLLSELEEKIKISFTIKGEAEYISSNIRPFNINLYYEDGHFQLRNNDKRESFQFGFLRPMKKENVITYYIDPDSENVYVYDGKHTHKMTYDKYQSEYYDYKNKKLLIKTSSRDKLVEEHCDYLFKADELLAASKGFINMYKSPYVHRLALDMWRQKSKSFVEPENMTIDEEYITDKAFHGGIYWYEEYEGYGVDYDINSFYSYCLISQAFTFPISQGVYGTLTTEEFESLEFYKYGYYKCKIGKTKTLKLREGWITHYDLTHAKEAGYEVELITDKGNNICLYEKRANGKKVFGDYINEMYNLKTEKFDTKLFMTSLWGGLCSKNKKTTRIYKDASEIVNVIGQIEQIEDNSKTTVITTIDTDNIFKYPYARIGPFLTAYARLQMFRKIKPYMHLIKAINCDGFIATEKIDLDFGDGLGQWKIKREGECIITNAYGKFLESD